MGKVKPKVAKIDVSLGSVLIWIAIGLFFLGWVVPFAVMTMIVERASGVILTAGYLIWARREWKCWHRFQWLALFLYLFMLFVIAVCTPVIMSTKVALVKAGQTMRS